MFDTPSHASPVAFDAIAEVVNENVKEIISQELVNTAWALATLHAVISFSAAIALPEGPELRDRTVWCLSAAGHVSPVLCDATAVAVNGKEFISQ
eukprot:10736499-Karenia_brevis.AAC.1